MVSQREPWRQSLGVFAGVGRGTGKAAHRFRSEDVGDAHLVAERLGKCRGEPNRDERIAAEVEEVGGDGDIVEPEFVGKVPRDEIFALVRGAHVVSEFRRRGKGPLVELAVDRHG